MVNAKISALPSATVPLAGTEVLPVVQGGTTDKVTAADLLRQNGQTVTTSNPVLSLAQTWNAGGVTFTADLINVTDTASAAASRLFARQVGGVDRFVILKSGAVSAYGNLTFFTDNTYDIGASGASRARSIYAGTSFVAPPGTVSAPGFTFTGDTDTGMWSPSADVLQFASNGTVRMTLDSSGNVGIGVSVTNPTYQLDVGNSTGGTIAVSTAGSAGSEASPLFSTINFLGYLNAVNGAITVEDKRVNIFGGWMNFHVRDSSDTLQKRMTIDNYGNVGIGTASPSTLLHVAGVTTLGGNLLPSADATYDIASAAAQFRDAYLSRSVIISQAAIPAGGVAGRGLRFSSTANFGVFFGSGTPTLSAAKGSLYLRSDGSGPGDRMYVNTDGATAWTAVTTAT
jgi:hypothetical protein